MLEICDRTLTHGTILVLYMPQSIVCELKFFNLFFLSRWNLPQPFGNKLQQMNFQKFTLMNKVTCTYKSYSRKQIYSRYIAVICYLYTVPYRCLDLEWWHDGRAVRVRSALPRQPRWWPAMRLSYVVLSRDFGLGASVTWPMRSDRYWGQSAWRCCKWLSVLQPQQQQQPHSRRFWFMSFTCWVKKVTYDIGIDDWRE